MNLERSDEDRIFADSIERFLTASYSDAIRQESKARADGCNRVIWRELADLGCFALLVPDARGGYGGSLLDLAPLMEAIGRHRIVEPVLRCAVMPARLLCGLPGQDAMLTALMSGETRFALAIEDSAGLAARPVAGQWLVSGTMRLVMGAPGADILLVAARTEHKGTGIFALSPDASGLQRDDVRLLDGGRASRIMVRDVVADPVPGPQQGVEALCTAVIDSAIVAAGWDMFGAMSAALDQTVLYVEERRQFGRAIGEFQSVQDKLAEMAVAREQARAALILASLKSGDEASRMRTVSAAKVQVAVAARTIANDAVQLHGGMGVSDETPIADFFRRLSLFEGVFGPSRRHIRRYADAVLPMRAHLDSALLAPMTTNG